jgi:hypothetical protein
MDANLRTSCHNREWEAFLLCQFTLPCPGYTEHRRGLGQHPANTEHGHFRYRSQTNPTIAHSQTSSKPCGVFKRQGSLAQSLGLPLSHFTGLGFQKNVLFVANKNNIPFPQQQQQQQQQPQQQFPTQTPFGNTSSFGTPQASQPGPFGYTSRSGFSAFGASQVPQQTASFSGAPQATNVFGAIQTAPPPSIRHPTFGRPITTPASARVSTDDPIEVLDSELELDYEEVEGTSALTEPTTIVSETPMAISFSVHGKSTIPSDGIDHQVSVAVLPFTAKISYIVIPRIDPRVFLQVSLIKFYVFPIPPTLSIFSARWRTLANIVCFLAQLLSSSTTAMFLRRQSM